jgi:hypothetical protein
MYIQVGAWYNGRKKKYFLTTSRPPPKIPQPRAPLLFSQQLLYLAKNINFCQSFFFQWSRVKKQRKHYKEHEKMHYYYYFYYYYSKNYPSFNISTSFFFVIPWPQISRIYQPKSRLVIRFGYYPNNHLSLIRIRVKKSGFSMIYFTIPGPVSKSNSE